MWGPGGRTDGLGAAEVTAKRGPGSGLSLWSPQPWKGLGLRSLPWLGPLEVLSSELVRDTWLPPSGCPPWSPFGSPSRPSPVDAHPRLHRLVKHGPLGVVWAPRSVWTGSFLGCSGAGCARAGPASHTSGPGLLQAGSLCPGERHDKAVDTSRGLPASGLDPRQPAQG